MLDRTTASREIWTVSRCIAEYQRTNDVPLSDVKLLDTLRPGLASMSTGYLNYDWADAWIVQMKREYNLAPSTIRHRHGALARCFDWMVRKRPDIMAQNPLRLLKRGFSSYTPSDEQNLLVHGKVARVDVERDRRLVDNEEARICAVLEHRPVELTFFVLALQTAMRMRECYTLDLSQVDPGQRTALHLHRSKNGDSRQVALPSPAIAALAEYMASHKADIAQRSGRLFPYWRGEQEVAAQDIETRNLSRLFHLVFEEAGIIDLHFHDLRHEATCRLYERTDLSDVLIAKITGHRDLRMLQRYASLRGSELAQRLW